MIKPEDIKTLASDGVGKFNVCTCLRKRFGNTVREKLMDDPDLFDRLTIMKQVIPEVSDEAEQMIRLLGQ